MRLVQNTAAAVDPTLDLCTRYPLMLGGQRQCGFKACPRLLTWPAQQELGPQHTISLVLRAPFSVQIIPVLVANLPPKCFSEIAHRPLDLESSTLTTRPYYSTYTWFTAPDCNIQ